VLTYAIWIIGIFTLLSGIVGVSNIMLITVRERTREFGIRKALGAKPSSILRLIIAESITITAIFGYIGMFLGIAATEYINTCFSVTRKVNAGVFSTTVFSNPTVDIECSHPGNHGTLIIAGTLAGFFPARKATKIRPIEALRAE
jgi:putative ABC transport system permease protein